MGFVVDVDYLTIGFEPGFYFLFSYLQELAFEVDKASDFFAGERGWSETKKKIEKNI